MTDPNHDLPHLIRPVGGGVFAGLVALARIPSGVASLVLANRHRDSARWARAANLFERAVAAMPGRQDLLIQAGNCRKEQGDFPRAIALYDSVTNPSQRPEALFQKALVLLTIDDRSGAVALLRAASAMQHDNAERRLREMSVDGADFAAPVEFVRAEPFPRLNRPIAEASLPKRLSVDYQSRRWLRSLDQTTHVPATEQGFGAEPHVTIIQAGWMRLDNVNGEEILLVGVVSIRARVMSRRPLRRANLKLDGVGIATVEPTLVKRQRGDRWLYVVNIWIDCDRLRPQRAKLSLVVVDDRNDRMSADVIVNVTHAPPSLELADCDSFVPSPVVGYKGSVAAPVLARPALVRSASRSMFSGPIKHVLVMRVDQLGDVSASLPAMARLRAVFPNARLTGVVSPGLVDIVRATGIFDTVHSMDLVYSHVSEKRYLHPAEEQQIWNLFGSDSVDIAIDLCPGGETRPLLKVFNARYLVGFDPFAFDFLDFGIAMRSYDKVNRLDVLSHAAHVSTLVESLAVAVAEQQPSVPRLIDDRVLLESYGFVAGHYIVIHSGARHAINCWPLEHYLDLAARLAGAFDLRVAFFADTEIRKSAIRQSRIGDRVRLMEKIAFDHFDAIVARAKLFVGNDSGPKHLAAVHGVDTVSIHINRLNWREWGQDGNGLVISKRVPCAGCGLNDETLCGMEVACIRTITVDEVFNAIRDRLIQSGIIQSENVRPDGASDIMAGAL